MVLRVLACRMDMFSASSHHGKVFWVSALWLSASSSFREEISETLRKVKCTVYACDLVPFFIPTLQTRFSGSVSLLVYRGNVKLLYWSDVEGQF